MKIVELRASNIKRLRAVEIKPSGDVVVLTGKNGAGKSSVLDAIAYALAGKSAHCPEPVRRGSKRAEVICDLGEIEVRRTFSAKGGTTLTVTSKGEVVMSPQRVLAALVGRLTFDPLAFSRMSTREQAESLRELIGLDTKDLDEQREAAYIERTECNRRLKELEARLRGAPQHPDAPEDEVSTGELLGKLEAARSTNERNQAIRDELEELEAALDEARSDVSDTEKEIERLEQKLKDERENLAAQRCRVVEAEGEIETQRKKIAELEDVDVAPIKGEIAGADELNRKVREQRAYLEIVDARGRELSKSRSLTELIDSIDEQKEQRLREAKFPVDGLSFNDQGEVVFSGLPFEQASQAEQLRVSVAMGIAANPELRILLIRDGSLLDSEGMELVARMAAEHDAQLWIERVEQDQRGAVVIEDGLVALPDEPDGD